MQRAQRFPDLERIYDPFCTERPSRQFATTSRVDSGWQAEGVLGRSDRARTREQSGDRGSPVKCDHPSLEEIAPVEWVLYPEESGIGDTIAQIPAQNRVYSSGATPLSKTNSEPSRMGVQRAVAPLFLRRSPAIETRVASPDFFSTAKAKSC